MQWLFTKELPTIASCNQGDFVQQSGGYWDLRFTYYGQSFYNQVGFQICSSEHGKMRLFSGNFLSNKGEFGISDYMHKYRVYNTMR